MIHCNTFAVDGEEGSNSFLMIWKFTEAKEKNRYLLRRQQKTGSHLVRVINFDGCAVFVVLSLRYTPKKVNNSAGPP